MNSEKGGGENELLPPRSLRNARVSRRGPTKFNVLLEGDVFVQSSPPKPTNEPATDREEDERDVDVKNECG